MNLFCFVITGNYHTNVFMHNTLSDNDFSTNENAWAFTHLPRQTFPSPFAPKFIMWRHMMSYCNVTCHHVWLFPLTNTLVGLDQQSAPKQLINDVPSRVLLVNNKVRAHRSCHSNGIRHLSIADRHSSGCNGRRESFSISHFCFNMHNKYPIVK